MNNEEITVFYADISGADAEKLYACFGPDMEPKRRGAIEKCSNLKVKKVMVCAGALLVRVLADYGLRASDIEYGEHGKPFLQNSMGLCFNLSHSGQFVLLAIGYTELGADIQKSVSYRENLVKRITLEAERKGREKEYSGHLNRVWAIKESYTKLTGEGLKLDFSHIQYEPAKDGFVISFEDRKPAFCRPVYIHGDYEAFVSAYGDFSVTSTSVDL